MTSAHKSSAVPARPPPRWRRFFWDGVLPEALGLCFVAIIFGGFATAYLIAEHAWRRQFASAHAAESDALAQLCATTVGTLAATPEAAESWLAELGSQPGLRAVLWRSAEGRVQYVWPPGLGLVAGSTTGAPLTDDPNVRVAVVPVASPDGTPLGKLHVETAGADLGSQQTQLRWNWGIAAGVTLLVFAGLYHRLRQHLRPMAAVEQNLQSYAAGLEHELGTLTLSDSLGTVAQGWNQLLREYADLRQQIDQVRQAGHVTDVLARFEGAVFRRVVDRLPFGVLCVDERDGISYTNASAAALLRRSPESLLGQPINQAIEDPAVMQALLGVRARGGGGMVIDQTRGHDEHETTLRYRVLPLAEPSARHAALITLEDIGVLRESQRARDNFLYHVTHELRTPLTNIHAYAETLTKPGFDDEQTRKECYNVIVSETRRLSRLVEDILSISQLEVGSARLNAGDVDLARLVRQTVQDNLGAADEKRIDLALTLPPKLPKLQGDKQRLAVLLNNLIGNAIKYTPAGGKVRVTAENDEQCLRIAVVDTGIGISAEDQAHVFDKFYRAADEQVQMVTGTGLGLALAREVARLHGGEIHLESEKGQGSTFTIELPLPNAEPAEAVR